MVALLFPNRKNFMASLLTTDTFDAFLIHEATLRTDVTYTIDCRLVKGFYSAEELAATSLSEEMPLPFGQLRPTLFSLIRGTHTPVGFRFTLALSPAETERLLISSGSGLSLSDLSGLLFNLRFADGALTGTTATGYRTFVTDHTLDRAWDRFLKDFLFSRGIIFEETA